MKKHLYKQRKVIRGNGIAAGIVLGQARIIHPGQVTIAKVSIPQLRIRAEQEALARAVEKTVAELGQLRQTAGKKTDGPVAKIFDAQLMIADDHEFLKSVRQEISDVRQNAGYVYDRLVQRTIAPLKGSPDRYMRQMALDIEAVANRILSHLSGNYRVQIKFPPNSILVGKLFSPGDILTFRERKAVGFMVNEGARNSHMALLSRAMLLPVVQVDTVWTRIVEGCRIIIDGTAGMVILNPTDEDWTHYQKEKKRQGPALISRIRKLTTIPPLTRDGQPVGIAANLTLPGPADQILSQRRIPIGLYRTEFLYLANSRFPDEEEQFNYYRDIAEQYRGTTVVLRTFDLGSDKIGSDPAWKAEDNPALGWRGIRYLLDRVDLFQTQIRAILRASSFRNLKIMLPLVSDRSELEKARRIISRVMFDLRKRKIDYDPDIPVGIMIEVPSAALTADALAEKCDFFSVGTNDLTQYTLAADRTNSRVGRIYSQFHPSVLKLIKISLEAAKRHNRPISICGEIAGDPLALPLFVGMGVDELSMSPHRIFDICRTVRKIDSSLTKHLVDSIINCDDTKAVLGKLGNYRSTFDKSRTSTHERAAL